MNQLYDMQTFEVMRKVLRHDSNCIDVGCHVGSVLDEMIKVSPHGIHHAFEPLPTLYADLKRKYSGNTNIKILPQALSNTTGPSSFHHVVTSPGYSGIKQRRYDRNDEVIEKISVEMVRMDEIIDDDFPVNFIKIDVEGAELQVLLGGIRTIIRSKPIIVFEHGLGAADY